MDHEEVSKHTPEQIVVKLKKAEQLRGEECEYELVAVARAGYQRVVPMASNVTRSMDRCQAKTR